MIYRSLPTRVALGAVLAVTVLIGRAALLAQGGAPVLNPAQVVGPNVTFTWSAVAGATGYTLRAGVTSGAYFVALSAGNTTTFSVAAPAVGTYFVRVEAIVNGVPVPSNEISLQVTSLFVPPPAPTDLTAFINGTSALITWTGGVGGGAPTNLFLFAGTTPGASDVGIFPIAPSATQLTVANVPARTYYLRMAAYNPGGFSATSNETTLVMPVGGGCSVPPARAFTTTTFGRYVQFNWTPVPGAAGYRLDFSTTPGGPSALSQPLGPAVARWSYATAPLGTFYGKLVTTFACGSTATGPEVPFTIDGAPPPGPRAANPAPGSILPFPSWGAGVINQLAAERPDLLNQSCREHGGNNRFMFEAVRRLRARDNRFGLNWKRGNAGDLSQDIVNYNYSAESDEGTRRTYIIDIIAGHCGPSPAPFWQDQTGATAAAGTIGIWTLLPYLEAGYPIVSDPQ